MERLERSHDQEKRSNVYNVSQMFFEHMLVSWATASVLKHDAKDFPFICFEFGRCHSRPSFHLTSYRKRFAARA